MIEVISFLLAGVVAGLLAGLLGVGGGMIIVPTLFYLFAWLSFPEYLISHIAVGTSLAVMVFTSLSSCITHGRSGFIDRSILKKSVPGVLLGITFGALLSLILSTSLLKNIFAIFLLAVALQMFLSKNSHKISKINKKKTLKFPFLFSTLFGMISSLLGVGAGSTFVPYLNYNRIQFNKAVGTSSAMTFIAAIWGTVCYLFTGFIHNYGANNITGFIYWPAVLWIAASSMLSAFIGAKLSHKTPSSLLRKIFAVILLLVALSLFLNK